MTELKALELLDSVAKSARKQVTANKLTVKLVLNRPHIKREASIKWTPAEIPNFFLAFPVPLLIRRAHQY